MEAKQVFLLPSELHVAKEPTRISTLLGSCVGICLYNRISHFGGMNHYMLPRTPQNETPSTRYGDYAIETLIKMMLAHDSQIDHLEASILGGGRVAGHLSVGEGIGASNILMARDMMDKYKIRVVHRDVGANYGRKILFENWTGQIIVKKIEKSEDTKEQEAKHNELLKRKIRVLIVDDSSIVREVLCSAVSSEPDIEVVGQASNPYEARELLLEKNPDVICLDVVMPKMDGITFLKKLFLYQPKPVIVISTVVQRGSVLRKQAEVIGAAEVLDKEELGVFKEPEAVGKFLCQKIRTAARMVFKKKTKEELDKL